MTTVAEVLEAYAPEISEEQFALELRARFEQVRGADDTSLTTGEQEFLTQHSGTAAGAVLQDWDPVVERRRRIHVVTNSVEHVYSQTLSAAEVAELTGKNRSQITRDLNGGKLYGLSVGRHWRIPRWQFAGRIPLPGLAQIVPAIPPGLHPTVSEGFMKTEQDGLDSRTPLGHLRTGGDPAYGAANSLAPANRSVCRVWAAKIRTTWPDLDGLLSLSTMTGRRIVTPFEPAAISFPDSPSFRRPLDHPVMQSIMIRTAAECGYTVAEEHLDSQLSGESAVLSGSLPC